MVPHVNRVAFKTTSVVALGTRAVPENSVMERHH